MPELGSNPLNNPGRDTRLPLGTFYPRDRPGGTPTGVKAGVAAGWRLGRLQPLAHRPQAEAARRVTRGRAPPSPGRGLLAAGRTQALCPRGAEGPSCKVREGAAGGRPGAPAAAAAAAGGDASPPGGVHGLQRSAGSQWALPWPRKHSTVT